MDESQPIPLSVEHCKELLKTIAKMLCVKAELISNHLLSKEDKNDMLNDEIPIESLILHVKVWMQAGRPNYANGNLKPLETL